MEWMFLPYKRYVDFEGRSRRMEYWMFFLFYLIVSAVLIGPFLVTFVGVGLANADDPVAQEAAIAAMFESGLGLSAIGLIIWVIFALGSIIPSIAVTVRRLHDRDMSGWWYLGAFVAGFLPFIGFVASIAMFVITVLPGTQGSNRFGPDPKDPYAEDVFA